MKRYLLPTLSLLIGLAVALLALEASLRLFRYQLLPFVTADHQPCIYDEDLGIGYRYRRNASDWVHRNFEMNSLVEINGDGFHDVDRTSLVDRPIHKIVALGDSFTAALSVPVSEGWTQTLERELASPGARPAAVINSGLDGSGTDVHVALLKEQLPKYRPETVILAFYRYDMRDLRPDRWRLRECYSGIVMTYQNQPQKTLLMRHIDEGKPGEISRWLYRNFYIFRAAARLASPATMLRINRAWPGDAGLAPIRGDDETENAIARRRLGEQLDELKRLSRQWDFRLLIIPVPAHDAMTQSLEILTENAPPQTLEGVEIVDVSPAIRSMLAEKGLEYTDMFWVYDGHLNSKGNEIFGRAIAQTVDWR